MRKTPKKHGGKRVAGPGKRIGRPKTDGALDEVFSVRMTREAKRLLIEKEAHAWARDVLLDFARNH